jgi:hypothetical protein
MVCAVFAILLASGLLSARTIMLTAEDCDMIAVLSARAPRLSWATYQPNANAYTSAVRLHFLSNVSVLLRFPLERIPTGQRITRAELTMTASYLAGKPEVHIRRVLAEWGTGVCHQYRLAYPEKLEWARPGGRGSATDVAAKETAVLRLEKIGNYTADVTEDIELWYTGGAANRGWLLYLEPAGSAAYFAPPYSPLDGAGKQWKLQITFEPR